MSPFFERLKTRKVVQWLLAYLGGAWALLEVSDILGGQFGWSLVVQRAFTVALGVGAVVTVVLAWYHGERGRQRVSGVELLMLAGVLGLGGGAMAWATNGDGTPDSALDVDQASSLVVLSFENRSADEGDVYFTDGIHDEILTRFNSIGAFRVISRTSAMSYRGSDKTTGAMG